MEITLRDMMAVLHGMGFGVLFMLAFSGALGEIFWTSAPAAPMQSNRLQHNLLVGYLIAMVVLAWLAVFSGAYIVYPWYRAVPPPGLIDLSEYPRRLLLSSGKTSQWHNVGMEWKENVAWLAPISMTMVAYLTYKYRRVLPKPRHMRTAMLGFAIAAFMATGIAGIFGAFLNKYAPVRGGPVIVLMGDDR